MPDLIGDDFSKPPPKFDFAAMGVTDGRVYFFVKGTDYDSSEANFRLHLSRYTDEHGGVYESRTVKNPDGSVKGMEVRFVSDPQPAGPAGPTPAAAQHTGSQQQSPSDPTRPTPPSPTTPGESPPEPHPAPQRL